MKCPYCNADIVSRKCIYCDSDLIDFIKKNGLDLVDYTESEPEKEPEESVEKIYSLEEILTTLRDMCLKLLQKYPSYFCAYDTQRTLTGGTEVKKRLIDLLKIPEQEEIFLIHDDTMMHSGKNGFAITDHGFYCRKLWEETTFISLEDLLSEKIRPEEISIATDASIYIKDPKTSVAYCSGNKELLEDLKIMYTDIFGLFYN